MADEYVPHDPLVLAYLAGVVDSDGYISIAETKTKGKRYFAATVGIAGTRRQPHDLAASLWGGNIRSYEPKNLRHRVQFQWCRSGVKAAEIIWELQPYLRVKQEQARLALEAQEHVLDGTGDDPYPWALPDYDPTDHLSELRQEMILVLNQGRRIADLPEGERRTAPGVTS